MRIDNKEYIKLRIRESLFYYILKDFKDLNYLIKDDKKIVSIVNKIYFNFIKELSKYYKIDKIININNLKEDFIYYYLENYLFNIIEDNIY